MKKYTKTKNELARLIGISRPNLDGFLSLEGAPEKTDRGWSISAVLEHIKKNAATEKTLSKADPQFSELKRRELLAKCSRLEFENEIDRGVYVHKQVFIEDLTRTFSAMKVELEAFELLAPQLAGLPVHEIAKRLRESIREVLQNLADCKWARHLKPVPVSTDEAKTPMPQS
jgi:hypothetical protein